jgi:hypothetical protein
VRRLDRHRLVVGHPQPLDAQDPGADLDVQPLGELLVGGDETDVEDLRAGLEPLGPHALREAGHLERHGQLGLRDEGALALDPTEPALDDQLLQGLPDGRTGGVERERQGPFRGYGTPRRQLLGHLQQRPLEQVVLRDAGAGGGSAVIGR